MNIINDTILNANCIKIVYILLIIFITWYRSIIFHIISTKDSIFVYIKKKFTLINVFLLQCSKSFIEAY